jgi:hypothetical protein
MKLSSRGAFESLRLLAPSLPHQDANFRIRQFDQDQHNFLLGEAQRLRGRVYLQDGAIDARQLSDDGRFVHPDDEHSWQLLVMDSRGKVAGCARYIPHHEYASFSELGVATSALARSAEWGPGLRRAVELERAKARCLGKGFAEVGGWALSEELRYSKAALEIFANVCALARSLGGAIAITTATNRHHSASILRRLGGWRLVTNDGVPLPTYYDPQYDCEMEILCFDSDSPSPRFVERVEECQHSLASIPAVFAKSVRQEFAMSASV